MSCPSPSDFEALRGQGIELVLSLLGLDEAAQLGLADEAALCAAAGMAFVQYPVADFGVPEFAGWRVLIDRLAARLRGGSVVAVHCRAGIGRSGMAASCLLIALGEESRRAVEIVSAARGVEVPETMHQGRFVASFENAISQKPR